MSNDYEVGYGRPPKEGRFKPGRSGNPSGRPRRSQQELSRGEIFWSIGYAKITLRNKKEYLRVSRLEAVVQRLKLMELAGDKEASRLLQQLRRLFPEQRSECAPAIVVISGDDAKL